MSDSGIKSAANKFALIYQFNNSSPLFARVAADEIENGNIEKAIEILEEGIDTHPNYPTAYLIYSKALALAGNLDHAQKNAEKAFECYDSDESRDYYMAQLEELSEKSSHLSDVKRMSFYDDSMEMDLMTVLPGANKQIPSPENDENLNAKEIAADSDNSEENKSEKFEDNLEALAEELSNAKMKIPPISKEDPTVDSDQISDDSAIENTEEEPTNEFISETLAGIYFAQGNLVQARNIYKKLIPIEPDKKDHYLTKIQEIDEKLKEIE